MPTALIIGGSSGIGLATAVRFASAGDTVHIAGRTPDRLTAATRQHLGLLPHTLDANDAAAVETLLSELGSVDRLIVTLSGNLGAGSLADLDLTVLRQAFDEKFWPTLTAVKVSAPYVSE